MVEYIRKKTKKVVIKGMLLSTKGRYGLKAVVDLAASYGQGIVTLSQLAKNQGISEAYLERIMRMLRSEGIVETVRGASGGYALVIPPDALSVEKVIRALEGSTAITDCVDASGKKCKNACTCSARPLFLTLQNRINDVLKTTMVMDLLNDHIEQKRRFDHE